MSKLEDENKKKIKEKEYFNLKKCANHESKIKNKILV